MDQVISRLIPEHAGEPLRVALGVVIRQAHPRARGGTRQYAPGPPLLPGSSPRTRWNHPHQPHQHLYHRLIHAHAGEPRSTSGPYKGARIIPAHAGKHTGVLLALLGVTDHPRVRGRILVWRRGLAEDGDSSPRIRENRYVDASRCGPPRIISTHAGEHYADCMTAQ